MKPILFNTEMVRAILKGQKTVTRRVVKPRPPCELRKMPDGYHAGEWHLYSENPLIDKVNHSPWGAQLIPPFQPDDILWVRETWNGIRLGGNMDYWYRADEPEDADTGVLRERWRPSIHMPKAAARIFLRVTEVRVERLQEINAEGILAEGLTTGAAWAGDMEIATQEFSILWNSTIKPADLDNCSWAANPWVWVIFFERCTTGGAK